MRKSSYVPQNLAEKRRRKFLKRQDKLSKREKIPEFTGTLHASGFHNKDKWSGLKPRKIEGFVLYMKGIKMTEKIWKKVYPEIPYNTRMRMV